ncbi:MAG: hypothetical protein ABI614_11155 [Planctomycetota bacterium]
MKRFASVVALLVLTAGCHAPMPSWNMFRPANATRLPPPATNYGATQPYYSAPPAAAPPTTVPHNVAPTTSPVGTGFRQSTANRWSNIEDPAIGPSSQESTWEPTRPAPTNAQVVDLREVDVALASHEAAAPFVPSTVVVEHNGPIRILPPDSSRSQSTRGEPDPTPLRGMIVNAPVRTSEPQPFVPSGRVVDISQLPDAAVSVSSAPSQTVTASSQSSTSQATVIDGAWKTRTSTLRVAGG